MLQGAVGGVWVFAATAEAKTSAPSPFPSTHMNGVGDHLQRDQDRTGSSVAVTIEEQAPSRTHHCCAMVRLARRLGTHLPIGELTTLMC